MKSRHGGTQLCLNELFVQTPNTGASPCHLFIFIKTCVGIAAWFILLSSGPSLWAGGTHMGERSPDFKTGYIPVDPDHPVQKWMLPFATRDRQDLSTVHVISVFGAYRSSYVRGHKHSGIDMVPKSRGDDPVWVYPIGEGIVCSIHLDHPHITIVVKHKTILGEVIYSSYKHLFAPLVKPGDAVSVNTRLGRIYTPFEGRRLGGRFDHLHLEIRKTFDDLGAASWTTMTEDELNKRFYDPLDFLKNQL